MPKRKTESAATLTQAATTQRVNELTVKNDEREAAAMRRQGMLHPQVMLEHKLECFFKTILGDSRYMDFMYLYQTIRATELDRLEEAIREHELTEGVKGLQLPGA